MAYVRAASWRRPQALCESRELDDGGTRAQPNRAVLAYPNNFRQQQQQTGRLFLRHRLGGGPHPRRLSAEPSGGHLLPWTLSSGPESGLCNQIFALVGYAVLAWQRKAVLVLPSWASFDNGGASLPYHTLWCESCMISALRSVNVSAVASAPRGTRVWRPARAEGSNLAGWRLYKRGQRSVERVAIEQAVLLGLQPSEPIRQRVAAARAELRLTAPHEHGARAGVSNERPSAALRLSLETASAAPSRGVPAQAACTRASR